MIRFQYLKKDDFEAFSATLFDILAHNMYKIVPTGNTREEDFACWYCAVGEGLKKENRQIVLIFDREKVNERSIAILQRLGLGILGETENSRCYHFKGAFTDLLTWFYR